jgi:hypothetical protein
MNASMIGRILLRQLWWRIVSLLSVDHRSAPYQRGLELLKANLTADQLNDFLTYRCFDVVGASSGTTYRIRLAGAMNVEVLDQDGWRIGRLCFFPEGQLVDGDIVLAQKVALEAFESEALAIANRFPPGPVTSRR